MVDPLNEIVIPLVGLITATILFYSPLREMREVDKTRLVGKLNVFPMACIPGNCFAWMVYALPTSNLWLWWSNLPSFMIGLWYMSVTLRATDLTAATYRMVQVVVGGGMLLVSLGLMMVIIAEDELSVAKNVVGAICILLLLVFYFAPLSTLVAVLRARDSSAFLLPLAVTTALNGAAWSAFGFYLGDAFLYGPNLIGAVNGCLQIGCCLAFPRTAVVAQRRAAAAEAALSAAADAAEAEHCAQKKSAAAGFGADGGFAPSADLSKSTSLPSLASTASLALDRDDLAFAAGDDVSAEEDSPQMRSVPEDAVSPV